MWEALHVSPQTDLGPRAPDDLVGRITGEAHERVVHLEEAAFQRTERDRDHRRLRVGRRRQARAQPGSQARAGRDLPVDQVERVGQAPLEILGVAGNSFGSLHGFVLGQCACHDRLARNPQTERELAAKAHPVPASGVRDYCPGTRTEQARWHYTRNVLLPEWVRPIPPGHPIHTLFRQLTGRAMG